MAENPFSRTQVAGNPFGQVAPAVTAPTAPQTKASMLDELLHQFGLTARAGVMGLTAGGAEDLWRNLGGAEPRDDSERMAQAIASGIAGSALGMGVGQVLSKAANPVAAGVGQVMKTAPEVQLAAGAVGGGAAETARQAGWPEWGQFLTSIAAPMASVTAAKGLARPIVGMKNILDAAFMPSGNARAAARVATDVAKDRAPLVVAEMKNSTTPQTAGQTAVPAGSFEFSGLEKNVGSRDPSKFGKTGDYNTNLLGWLKTQRDNLNTAEASVRNQILQDADQTGLSVAPLSQEVAAIRSTPGHKDVTTAHLLDWLDAQIAGRGDPFTADIKGIDLYDLRRDFGKYIKKMNSPNAEGVPKAWDNAKASEILRSFQKSIDWEIENAAGNTNWTDQYMKPSANMRKTLDELVGSIKANRQMASEGAAEARRITNLDEAPVKAPNLLERGVMVGNALMRVLQGYGGERTSRELERLMAPDGKNELARRMALELAKRGGRNSWRAALTGAGLGGAEGEMVQ